MKFKGYNFPHPIEIYNDFNPHILENSAGVAIKSEKFNLSELSFSIQNFIQNNKADVICEIQCSDTFFRKIELISHNYQFDFIIDKNLYRNKIEFEFSIVSKENSTDYEIDGRKYYLENGDVICSLGKFSFGGGDGTIASLLKFNENKDNDEIRYNLENHYVTIELPIKIFEKLRILKNNPNFSKIFISSIFQPSLIYICSFLDDDTYEGKEWFDFLRQKWNLLNENSEFPEKKEIPNFVQTLLNNPLFSLIDTLESMEKINNLNED